MPKPRPTDSNHYRYIYDRPQKNSTPCTSRDRREAPHTPTLLTHSSTHIPHTQVDDTDASSSVLDFVLSEIYRAGDELHILHVIPVPMPEVMTGGFGAMDSVITVDPDPAVDLKHIADAKEMLRTRFTPTLVTKNVLYQTEIIHFPTDTQSIGEAICARAKNLNAFSIAMAKHARGKINTFFFGSTSRYVAEHATCPVIIVS